MNKVEWISVNDILPEEDINVLILREGLSDSDMFVASFKGDHWLINGTSEVIDEISVDYWAELPELPMEE